MIAEQLAKTSEKRGDELAKTSKNLMLVKPFYGLFLIMLNKRWDNKAVPTAGVSVNGINYQLYLNTDFWDKITERQRGGLMQHELMHIGFFHLTDFKHQTDHLLSNIAKDIEINQYIDIDDLPPGPQLPSTYPELNLELKKGSNYYYDKLMQGKKDGNCPNLEAAMKADGQGEGSFTKGDGDEVGLPEHGSWDELADLDEATQKLIRKQTEHILKEVADQVTKSHGTVPGEFQEILNKIAHIEPPKFDWKAYLRRFAGGSTKIYTKKTRRKYNKRYEDNPGLKIKPRRHILVALDTSGSVSTNELNEFLHEIYHIQKTGTEITIAQADTSISHIGTYNHRVPFTIHGRGGTSFHPVLEYYNKNTHKYTCLVYLTDGEAPAPPAARGRMLWVMSSQSNINPELIGPQIKLN